ncbi:MAG TPA: hypothetical protein PKM43_14215 [Verrucomicrobiota bacterium]|nr:hypothetical protein [Verrucomicrobiota bacterium]
MAFDIAVDSSGGFVVTGRRGVVKGNVDWHVRAYNASRALVWEDTYAGAGGGTDDAYEVVADGEGNFVVAGYTLNGAGDLDWLVIKYRGSDGQRMWTRTFESGAGRSEACYAVAVDGLDNALVAGHERGEDGKTHWRLEHLSKADGQVLASQVWASAQDESLYAVAYRDRQIALGGTQHNGTNTDWKAIVAVPPPSRIVACDWTPPNLLTLEWQGAMEPVTISHSPTLSPPDWQPMAGPLVESGWTGTAQAPFRGFLRLGE